MPVRISAQVASRLANFCAMSKLPDFVGDGCIALTPAVVATLNNIKEQKRMIAMMVPGTRDHELATKILFILEDSLHAIASAQALVAKLKR